MYDYLTQVCGVKENDIVLWGRSMGSGPVCYLASRKRPQCIIVMSGYISIKDVTKTLFGWAGGLVSNLVYEKFKNKEAIAKAQCPVFFLHGMKDTLIPYTHA